MSGTIISGAKAKDYAKRAGREVVNYVADYFDYSDFEKEHAYKMFLKGFEFQLQALAEITGDVDSDIIAMDDFKELIKVMLSSAIGAIPMMYNQDVLGDSLKIQTEYMRKFLNGETAEEYERKMREHNDVLIAKAQKLAESAKEEDFYDKTVAKITDRLRLV